MTPRGFLGGAGAAALLGGVVTLVFPTAAGLTVTVFAGWIFLMLGLVLGLTAITVLRGGLRLFLGLLAGALLLAGVELISDPLAGLVAITAVMAVVFLTSGLSKMMLGRAVADARMGWGMLLSGGVSVLLAIVVLFNLQAASSVLLGVMLGIELVSTGLSALILSRTLR